MTPRAALYARFSTDNQSAASIADQLRACRAHADRLGAVIVAEFEDAAISGQAMANRPGVRALMAAARAGRLDVVIAEHTDRLSRRGSQGWEIFEDLEAIGVSIDTVQEGRVTDVHVGVSSMMSALMIKGVAAKTRRGLEGVVRSGRSGGGLSYGYRIRREYDAGGEPVRGLREIDQDQALVVRRIFRAYAAGQGPRAIAASLNADQVSGPTGGPWNASTIAGNAARGNGVIHNRLYIGELVWGRQTFTKQRDTGRRRSRAADPAGLVVTEAPELRIIDEPLWEAVRRRHAQATHANPGGRPRGQRQPARLLSGLVKCGLCGGRMVMSGPGAAMRCQTRIERGPDGDAGGCGNGRAPAYAGVEARVLASVQANLLHPDAIAAAVDGFAARVTKARKANAGERLKLEKELGETERRARRLVDQIADGQVEGRMVSDRLRELEARRAQLEADLKTANGASGPVALHPGVAGMYRKLVEDLRNGIQDADELQRLEARDSIRRLVTAVYLTPLEGVRGQYSLDLEGDLAPLLRLSSEEGVFKREVVAGARTTVALGISLPVRLAA